MTREEAERVKVGDMLKLVPFWSEGRSRHKLLGPRKVLAIVHEPSQTGILFRVKGHAWALDAGWFESPDEKA